jgi:light-regulated signal transduction histidine kinase (bacteriophytochrome)
MMNYTAMRQKKPVIRDSAERKRKGEVLSSCEEHVRARQLRELHMALEETGRLKELNAKLRQFTVVISHDLREPLRMISAYAHC